MLDKPFVWVGPVTKNVVECVGRLPRLGLIPTENQVGPFGGYVGYDIKELHDEMYAWRPDVNIERDHGSGILGFMKEDSESCDLYHIDPWKNGQDVTLRYGVDKTIQCIRQMLCYNPNMQFEIGTEESARHFSINDYDWMLNRVYKKLSLNEFSKIVYVVVQSGVELDLVNMRNKIKRREDYKDQIDTVHSYGLKTKEHNGDYIDITALKIMKGNGLDAVNIAPQLGQIESATIYDNIEPNLRREFNNICIANIPMWNKWITGDSLTDRQIICLGGHYVFNTAAFAELQKKFPENISVKIHSALMRQLSALCSIENQMVS